MEFDFIALAAGAVKIYLSILPKDLARYLIGAGGVFLVVNIWLAKLLAERKIRPQSPNRAQMQREFFASMRTVVIFAAIGGLLIVGGVNLGTIHIDRGISDRGWVYFLYNVAVLIILHDAWFYWSHRAMHHPRLFRHAHRLHHKSFNPSPWTSYSFDVVEAVVNAIYLPVALVLVPSTNEAIFVFLIHMMGRNALGHCGFEVFPAARNGRPMFDWITTVTHHDLHHAQAGWNYGLYFTWWDRLMKTEHPLYHEKFSEAVRIPLDGSAVRAMSASQEVK